METAGADLKVVEVVEGIRLKRIDEGAYRTTWNVEQGDGGMFTRMAHVVLVHPQLDNYTYSQKPITDEQIQIFVTSGNWYSSGRSITAPVALGVAKALEIATKEAA